MDQVATNIFNKIVELSDVELQKKMWLNENNDTGKISSYIEVMCSLFDDNAFDDFVSTNRKEVPSNVMLELRLLKDLLNSYNEKESDKDIINDEGWLKIVNQAKKVLKDWNF